MLLRTIEEFKTYITNLDAGFEDLEYFQPHLNTAEDWLKREIIGSELYNHLNTTSGMLTGEIYDRCREVIALQAYINALDELDVIQTPTGLGVINTNNYAPASRDRSKKLIQSLKSRLDIATEDLIDYLIGSDKEYLDRWKESEAHSKIYNVLVYCARDFSEYYNIYDNRSVYLNIRNDLKAVELTKIADRISSAFLNEIKTKQKEYQLTEKINQILPELKLAEVYYAMSSAVYSGRIMIKDNTIELSGPDNAFTRATNRKLQADFFTLGNEFLRKVVNHLKKNIDDYPTYKESDAYARETYSGYTNDNETDPIFVGPS